MLVFSISSPPLSSLLIRKQALPSPCPCGLLLLCFLSRPISSVPNSVLKDNDKQDNIYHDYSDQLRQCNEPSFLHHAKAIHGKLIKAALPFTLFLHNHLLTAYFKCGHQSSALQLFDEMPHKNVVSCTSLIAGFLHVGCPGNAISVFCSMCRQGFKPNEFTFVSVLQASSLYPYLNNFPCQIYGMIIRYGYEPNVFLLNAYLTSLIRHNQLAKASEAFEKCLDKDIVSWNAMMAGYVQFSKVEIPDLWCRMNRMGIKPDNFTFASVLTGLADLSDLNFGVQVHTQLVKSGHGSEMCVGNSLVDMYLKSQNFSNGVRAFGEIPVRDVWSWTQMASGCLHCGEPNAALAVIGAMKKMGMKPNKFTLATMLNACASLASLEEGKKVHGLRIKLGDDIDVCVDNALLDMYAKCGCMDGALGVFRSMGERSIVSWTTMIMAYAQNGQPNKAVEIFDELARVGMKPNYVTFICVLYACCQGGFVEQAWKYLFSMKKDYGILPGEDHYVCMVDLLGRVGRTKEAEELILSMPFQASGLVWKTLLGACRVNGDIETANRAAKHALDLDSRDSSTYVLVSNLFAGLSNWEGVGMLRVLMETKDVKKMPASSWIEINSGNMLARADG